jgi:RNase P/RNase MRP subunit p30
MDVNNLEEIEKGLRFCEELRINNVILESKNHKLKFNSKLKSEIKKKGSHINIYFRTNLRPKNLGDFKAEISQYGNTNEIVSVECLDKQIQIHAAKDSRVDIISYSTFDILKTISPGVISLTKQNNSFIEFSLAPIMTEIKVIQSKNLRSLYRGVQMALNLRANYIINGNFENKFDFRHPRGLISICHTLLGMSIQNAKNAFSHNVTLLLKKVNNRQDNKVIETGVELIKNGI